MPISLTQTRCTRRAWPRLMLRTSVVIDSVIRPSDQEVRQTASSPTVSCNAVESARLLHFQLGGGLPIPLKCYRGGPHVKVVLKPR
jgi:hypothetical protein